MRRKGPNGLKENGEGGKKVSIFRSVDRSILEQSGLSRKAINNAVGSGYIDIAGAKVDDSYNF